jgi:hypothetical protein
MEPQSIKAILQSVLRRTGIAEKMEERKALLLWDDVASNLAARTEPVGITRGRMAINVTDSVVLHQLTFYKRKYIDKINLMLGKRIVKDIVFRVGKVEKGRGARGTGGQGDSESRDDYIRGLRSVQLDQDELTRIDEMVAQIEDEEIRNSLRELFISQSKLFKYRSMGQ